MHDFSVIPRCYKDVYVNSIFSRTVSLWNYTSAKRFAFIYDLNSLISIVSRHFFFFFFKQILKKFLLFSSSFPCNVILRSGCLALHGLNPSKKIQKSWT